MLKLTCFISIPQADKLTALIKAAKVEVEPFWPGLFAKALEGHNISDLLQSVGTPGAGAAPAGGGAAGGAGESKEEEKKEEKKEESEEESDEDMGFGEYTFIVLSSWGFFAHFSQCTVGCDDFYTSDI